MSRVVVGIGAMIVGVGFMLAGDLKKLSMDSVSTVGPLVEADAATKVEGKASLKITTPGPASVCLGEVMDPDIENASLVFNAKVKTELEGEAYLEMWVEVGGGKFFARGIDDPVKGKSDWKSIKTLFMLQKGQKPEKATLNVIVNGKGTVWVDDVVLSGEPLKQ